MFINRVLILLRIVGWLALPAISSFACSGELLGERSRPPERPARFDRQIPDLLNLPARSSQTALSLDPAMPVNISGSPLVSSGAQLGNPLVAEAGAGGVEWAVYSTGPYAAEDRPWILTLDLMGSVGPVWLAVANFDRGVWEWQQLHELLNEPVVIGLPQDRQLYRATDGAAFFCLAVHDDSRLEFHGGTLSGTASVNERLFVYHHSGQSFITWPEDGEQDRETYRVYRHGSPITADNLTDCELLYEVPEGSAAFYCDRYLNETTAQWEPRYIERYVITDFGQPLPAGTGLLVWTVRPVDYGGDYYGNAYYAVSVVSESGDEDLSRLAGDLGYGPVAESVADPLPVEVLTADDGRAHLFIQYMDIREWNPTFHAPNALNGYFGLSTDDWQATHALQYAYSYIVREADPANLATLPAPYPVLVYLHGWDPSSYRPELVGCSWYSPMQIEPLDVGDTWFYGFATDHDYRIPGEVAVTDAIANYTEQRVLRMIYDLQRHPRLGKLADPQRVYVYGGSMGGSGTLALALRYPNVFACAYAGLPMTNYLTCERWRADLEARWGRIDYNLPVKFSGPGNWAAHLATHAGTRVWDWQNHQLQLELRSREDITPLGIKHGRLDDVIDWATQGKPVYELFNAGDFCWGGIVLDISHVNDNWLGLPPCLIELDTQSPFYSLRVVKNESVPGLSNASGDAVLPPADAPAGPQGWNQALDWSASWNSWAGAPLDTATRWEISLRTLDGSTQQVDVTPRRLQHFKIKAGQDYIWTNRRCSDGALLDYGTIRTDVRGLLVVPHFTVSPTGNTLSLELQGP